MASNYPQPHQPVPPTMSYSDGLIPNDNPHTLYPEVYAKHDPPYHLPSGAPGQMPLPPAYPHELGGHEPGPEKPGRPFWKKSVTWVAIGALVIIAILAGLLAAVATGSIKTVGNTGNPGVTQNAAVPTNAEISESFSREISSPTSSRTSETVTGTDSTTPTSTTMAPTLITPTPSAPPRIINAPSGPVTMECPGVDELNLDVSSDSRGVLRFQRLCDVNYPHGDTDAGFGLVKDKRIASLTDCIKACANKDGCVGAVFNDRPQCWLKNTLGTRKNDEGTEAAIVVQR